uniref:Interleukin-1 n=1 Tax=Spermophilus dauricus TaxID=99837 RepID=A0A8C9Q475_SPEDA
MAKVPDLFEDLKDCYSEDEDYNSTMDHLSLHQKSFYTTSYHSLGETCVDKLMSRSTSETSKTSKLTFQGSLVLVSANGKTLKKRRLSFNQPISNDDLEAIAYDLEEEPIKPRSASRLLQSNVSYTYKRIIQKEFALTDPLHQSIIQDPTSQYLKATSLTDQDQEVKFDMGAYISTTEDSKFPVTLRISKTHLFVSAQEEDEPVLLKEMPETPKTITGSDTNLIFFWESHSGMNYFTSAAHPELLIATKVDSAVHMAKGLPSMTEFQIS